MVLNIPPPPSDRLWYSFKERPELGLRIVPYYGDVKLGEDNTFFSSAVNKTIAVVVRRWVPSSLSGAGATSLWWRWPLV
jgi:hypothetical protein